MLLDSVLKVGLHIAYCMYMSHTNSVITSHDYVIWSCYLTDSSGQWENNF